MHVYVAISLEFDGNTRSSFIFFDRFRRLTDILTLHTAVDPSITPRENTRVVWFYGSPPNFSLTKSPVLKPAPGRIS